jgi:hypothetical protein
MRKTLLTIVLLASFAGAAAAEAAVAPATTASGGPERKIARLERTIASLRAELAKLRPYAPAAVRGQITAARSATARFENVEAALAAGYVAASPCEASPLGGMGIHYVNPAALQDPKLQATKPEILLYEPTPAGPRLVGVEYFLVDADQNLGTDGDRPSLFGRSFDGPMLGHAPGMPIHYDLHVWLHKRNPGGLFAQWNPDVRCP